jgi:hypothetical protein
MRCKACDVVLWDWEDPELCEKCLATISPGYTIELETPNTKPHHHDDDPIDEDDLL